MAEAPSTQGLYIGEQLRRLRVAAGKSLLDAAHHLNCSEAKASRMEGGRSRLKVGDVEALLEFYGAPRDLREHLAAFTAQTASRPTGWWREHKGHLGSNVPQYLALEQVASEMRNIEPVLIPGLLQTEAYAREVLEIAFGDRTKEEAELRIQRQRRILEGELQATFIIGEVALRTLPDSVKVEQLDRLIQFAELPNVRIYITPNERLAAATRGNQLVLLSFAHEGMADVAYIEHWAGSFVVDEPADVRRFRARYEEIRDQSMSPLRALKLVRQSRRMSSRRPEEG